jgi:hypothetical protein
VIAQACAVTVETIKWPAEIGRPFSQGIDPQQHPERATGLEPATSSLRRRTVDGRTTAKSTELHALAARTRTPETDKDVD